MGSFTTYGRSQLLSKSFITSGLIGPTLIALTSVIPGTTDDVTRLVEPVGGAYTRKAYSSPTGWEAGAPGEIFNTYVVTFAAATADWGAIRGWALLTSDAAHVIASGALKQVTVVKLGMTVVIPVHGIRAVLK